MKPSARAMAAGLVVATAAGAAAQEVRPPRATTLIVGPPPGASPTLRSDAARSGRARLLPASPRVVWRKALDRATPLPPLARPGGGLVALLGTGDVAEIDELGNELSRVSLAPEVAVAATTLSDGSVLVVTRSRGLILVRGGRITARSRVAERTSTERGRGEGEGSGDSATALALSLDDGGAVVALDSELIAVDSVGGIRARAAFPSRSVAAALVAAGGVVYTTLSAGNLLAWVPGGELRRVGRFRTSGTLVAAHGALYSMGDGQTLERFDPVRQATTAIYVAPANVWLGVPSATAAGLAMLSWQAGRLSVLEVDVEGRERRRLQVATSATADGGAGTQAALGDVLTGPGGRVAFVTLDGAIGVLDENDAVRTTTEVACPRGRRIGVTPPVGLVATDRGFVVACDSGLYTALE